jgi:DNA repair exonuclease SbcCD nuclease subunit
VLTFITFCSLLFILFILEISSIADCDIGVWRDSTVRELSISAFETAIDQCVEEKVDFVLIARDLLHMNLPELSDVARAATKLN